MINYDKVKAHLKPGEVYRRSNLANWSRSVDRDLAGLIKNGSLIKVYKGLYLCPQHSRFGVLPASTDKLLNSFLNGNDYLVVSPNDYNALGLGTTQLYNYQIVYNHKRNGRIELGGQVFEFHRKAQFPKEVTPEFLLVDLINNLSQLAEDREAVLVRIKAKVPEMDPRRLRAAIESFATVSTRKFMAGALVIPL